MKLISILLGLTLFHSIARCGEVTVIKRLVDKDYDIALATNTRIYSNEPGDRLDVLLSHKGVWYVWAGNHAYTMEIIYQAAKEKYSEESKKHGRQECVVWARHPDYFSARVSQNYVWFGVHVGDIQTPEGKMRSYREVGASLKDAEEFIDAIKKNSESIGFEVTAERRKEIIAKTNFKVDLKPKEKVNANIKPNKKMESRGNTKHKL